MTFYFIVAIILVGLVEIKPLIKKEKKREIMLVSVILFCALFTLMMEGLKLPSPYQILYNIISPISKLLFKS